MQFINKEWTTPEDCLRIAQEYEAAAKKFENPGIIDDLLGKSKQYRAKAKQLYADAQDLRLEAAHLVDSRLVDRQYLADHPVAA